MKIRKVKFYTIYYEATAIYDTQIRLPGQILKYYYWGDIVLDNREMDTHKDNTDTVWECSDDFTYSFSKKYYKSFPELKLNTAIFAKEYSRLNNTNEPFGYCHLNLLQRIKLRLMFYQFEFWKFLKTIGLILTTLYGALFTYLNYVNDDRSDKLEIINTKQNDSITILNNAINVDANKFKNEKVALFDSIQKLNQRLNTIQNPKVSNSTKR